MNTTDFVICVGVIGLVILVILGGMSALMLSDIKKRLDHLCEKNVDDIEMYILSLILIYELYSEVDCTMTISVVLLLLLIAIPITMLVIYAA